MRNPETYALILELKREINYFIQSNDYYPKIEIYQMLFDDFCSHFSDSGYELDLTRILFGCQFFPLWEINGMETKWKLTA